MPPEAQAELSINLSKNDVLDEFAIDRFRKVKEAIVQEGRKKVRDLYG